MSSTILSGLLLFHVPFSIANQTKITTAHRRESTTKKHMVANVDLGIALGDWTVIIKPLIY